MNKICRSLVSFIVVVFIYVCVIPGLNVSASESTWTRINNAVENMNSSVTVNSSVPWTWIEMQGLQHGAMAMTDYCYSIHGNGTITYYFTYCVSSLSEYNAIKAEMDNMAAQIASSIPSSTTSVEKARMIHDWLITHTVYDYTFTNPNSHNLYGVLHDHVAVCSGFSCAFKFLMNYIGEECSIVHSNTHAWNQVSANPNIYIDCTWDNQDYQSENGQEYVSYEYFAIDDYELSLINDHSIIGRTQDAVSSHSEYLQGDSIATMSFDEYSTESIAYYCLQMRDLGFSCFTVDFNNAEGYQNAINNMYYLLENIELLLGPEYDLCSLHVDEYQTIIIYSGWGHSMVSDRNGY